MANDFDISETTPAPTLFEAGRETHPQAVAWAEREVAYVTEIAQLKSDKVELVREKSQLAIEVNRLRKLLKK